MFDIKNIDINFTEDITIFYIGLIFLIFYSFYTYKYTVPTISRLKKTALTLLRMLGLFFIFISIFQPTISYYESFLHKPNHIVFIDDSKSIQLIDSNTTSDLFFNFNNFHTEEKLNLNYYKFSSKVLPATMSNLSQNGVTTNFENVFQKINSIESDISTITIISDGISNAGKTSHNQLEYLNTPIFTVGIGDSTKGTDVKISKINHNQFVYCNNKTDLEIILETNSLGKQVELMMTDNDGVSISKNVKLNSQFSKVIISYTPVKNGRKKINFNVSNLLNEKNTKNNFSSIFINVLNNKTKVGLISASISNDYRFIKNIIRNDKSKEILEFLKINSNSNIDLSKLDECEVLFFIGFPSEISTQNELQVIKNIIQNKKKPFFFIMSSGTDFKKIHLLSEVFEFSIPKADFDSFNNVSVKIEDFNNPLFKINSLNPIKSWKNLPPIQQPNFDISLNPNANVIASSIADGFELNSPIVHTSNINGIKSIYVYAANIWKWQLNNSIDDDILNRFINSSIKWLIADDEISNILVSPTKEVFNAGEEIIFTGKVYSEIFEPINNANITIEINGINNNRSIRLTNESNGNYSGHLELNKIGKFNYSVQVSLSGKKIFSKKGTFEITNSDIEFQKTEMNSTFLKELSAITNGEYFSTSQLDKLFSAIKKIDKENKYFSDVEKSYSLHINKYVLFSILLIFSIEWILRKRWRLL